MFSWRSCNTARQLPCEYGQEAGRSPYTHRESVCKEPRPAPRVRFSCPYHLGSSTTVTLNRSWTLVVVQ